MKISLFRENRPVGVTLLVAGMVATLGFAPFFVWPLTLAAVALLYIAVREARSPWQAAIAGLVWALGHQLTALYWLPRAFYLDAGESVQAAVLGGIPALIGLALYGAAAVALVCALARAVPPQGRAPAFVALWLGMEIVKSLSPLGFPWLPLGAVWGGSLPLMQAAMVGGVHGMSVLILATAVLLTRPAPWRWRTAAVLLLAVYSGGMARLASAPEVATAATDQPWLRLVQPNIQSAHRWDAAKRMLYLQQALNVAGGPGAATVDVFVLPETAVAFYLQEEEAVRHGVASGLREGQQMVTGTVRRETNRTPEGFFNSITVLTADGSWSGWYDKRLLVPFGEYIPFRGLIDRLPLPAPVRVMSQSRLDYLSGPYAPQLATGAGTGVGLICYEGIFPYHVAVDSKDADYLVNITNDNWFTGTTALSQHATLERLRAVENGIPLVRVANTGLTLVADGYGRIVATLPINTATFVDVALPPKLPAPPFAQAVRLVHSALK